jgi:transcriptional regulator with PAS, ATPase and Fis domain
MAGLSESLFESEFFGHIRGAFTGADQNRMGLAEAAHGGDLFLDEIEALPLSNQAKLLRFLESGEVRRLGSRDSIHVSVRVIAATNQNLQEMVQKGQFREDLLYRINGKKIRLAPLRERKGDVSALAQHFLSLDQRRSKTISAEALFLLEEHVWPGNVRELKRFCEQLVIHAPLPIIRSEDVRQFMAPQIVSDDGFRFDFGQGLGPLVEAFETKAIQKCLEQTNDVDEAARVLQVSRSNLYKKIKDLKIAWKLL